MDINLGVVRRAKQQALPAILAELARLTAIATMRLVRPPRRSMTVEPEAAELLTPAEVAAILKIDARQVRRLAALRPLRSRALGPKTLRYQAVGVRRLAARRGA